ncbi:MAG: LysM peptidoglycan-binding domain-containing protein, partial [Chitinophagaceae bacterium]
MGAGFIRRGATGLDQGIVKPVQQLLSERVADTEKRKQLKYFTSLLSRRNIQPMMRIKFFLLLMIVCQGVNSQTGLIIQGASPDLHLVHTVVAKENWYSIGRIYNTSPKDLAPYNKTTIEKPLAIGQLVRIPLTNGNFSQNGSKQPDENLIPLFHIVQEKEGMYRVSVTYNKVSSGNLKKWNNLSSDQLKNGMKLVVGYLKVKADQSPFASGGSNKITIGSGNTEPAKEPVKELAQNEKKATSPVSQPTMTPPVTPPVNQPVKEAVKEAVKEPAKEVTRQEPAPVSEDPAVKPEVINPAAAPANHKGGFFKKQFAESGKT